VVGSERALCHIENRPEWYRDIKKRLTLMEAAMPGQRWLTVERTAARPNMDGRPVQPEGSRLAGPAGLTGRAIRH
jgi:hypothetical protein